MRIFSTINIAGNIYFLLGSIFLQGKGVRSKNFQNSEPDLKTYTTNSTALINTAKVPLNSKKNSLRVLNKIYSQPTPLKTLNTDLNLIKC